MADEHFSFDSYCSKHRLFLASVNLELDLNHNFNYRIIMRFNISGYDLTNAESWLIILVYVGFSLYSSYSLIALLRHIYRQDNAIEDESLEVNN